LNWNRSDFETTVTSTSSPRSCLTLSAAISSERADIGLEERELLRDPDGELRELAGVYEQRGLAPALASEVAVALSRGGALAAHARDELGLDEQRPARPFQAAWTSALSFSAGAALPLVAVAATPGGKRGSPSPWSSR